MDRAKETDNEIHHVLWTGGWDSTFRVLQLVLTERARVQPHYIRDPDRQSLDFEIRAIESITNAIRARDNTGLLNDPHITDLDAIPVNDTTRRRHARLVEHYGIGPQYLWLSEYARWQSLPNLELSIHLDDRAHAVMVESDTARRNEMKDARQLLECFDFPVLALSKRDMRDTAREQGFGDLMNLTWFCHIPTRSGKPCGFCNPCRWTVDEGLPERLPASAIFRKFLFEKLIRHMPGYTFRRKLAYWLRRLG